MYGSIPNRLSKNQRALSKYSVGSDEPGLAFDFVDNVYRKGEGQTANLSSAITHARAGNATMTDGYGPELVTNGGFDSDVSSWSTGGSGSATFNNGRLHLANTASNFGYVYQSITTEIGKTYIVEGNFTKTSWNCILRVGTSANNETNGNLGLNTSGRFELSFTATATTTFVTFIINNNSSGSNAYFDNVSVREMPVIKWAPHNLLTYSEDFSNAAWTKFGTASITGTKTINLPAVDDRIYQSWSSVAGDVDTFGAILSGSGTVTLHLASGGINVTEQVTLTSTPTLYSVSGTATINATGFVFIRRNSGDTATSLVCDGAMRYRSDLGGMVDNPDRGDSYVPTTSAAKYLPRVGHHVYNGSAWVNEGVLAESEARVNLVEHSTPDTNWTLNRVTMTENNAVSPDGTENATRINETTATNSHYIYGNTTNVTSGLNYTLSAYVKADTSTACQLLFSSTGFGSSHYANFDLSTGTVGYEAANATATIQDVGNGWYRCAITSTATATASTFVGFIVFVDNDASSSSRIPSYAGDTAQQMYVYGAQVEEASTPSSLIPTSGSTVSRAAETFTIPSANLPWPTPQYIGSELVTNGTFDTDTTGWTASNATLSVESGSLKITSTGGNRPQANQTISTTVGKVYEISAIARTTSGSGDVEIEISGIGSNTDGRTSNTTDTRIYHVFVATSSFHILQAKIDDAVSVAGDVAYFDNISVREINPLSVSIGMEGRMTYADTDQGSDGGGQGGELQFVSWRASAANYIHTSLKTNAGTGGIRFRQEASSVGEVLDSNDNLYSPDILVPYSIASRHGSTFINGAVDGVALTADTTPVALPDLSSTDLSLAPTYMGTISEFRVWDKDLGDAGIVEATNPSLEPSLSLTFEGTGTNSFVVNNWSE